jgi:uncharacterized protein YecT (DUF1311 family)
VRRQQAVVVMCKLYQLSSMKKILPVLAILLHLAAFSQNDPQEVTPAIQKSIRADIDKAVLKLQTKLKNAQESNLQIEFTIDTFRIEEYYGQYLKYDYTTAGMTTAGYEAANAYDSLLNKYYKKLSNRLKSADRGTLMQAQKAWIAFRDAEEKLIGTVSQDEYSGGGTVQQLIDTSQYLQLVKQRVIQIFEHLDRVTDH